MGFLDNTGLTLVLNKIMAIVGKKQDELTFDKTPTAGSSNPVTSGGVYTAIANISSGGGGSGEAVQEIFFVDGTFDMSTFTFSTDVTFVEIAEQAVFGKDIKARARVEVSGYLVQIIYLPISVANVLSTVANFEGTMQVEGSDLGLSSGRILLAVSVEISSTSIRTKIRALSATDLT